jgi:hypothetical protein
MTLTTPPPGPPQLAAWLVELFASAEQAESILGDLHEEFSDIASKSGVVSARRWYWRQGVRTILHLVAASCRDAPWLIAGVVLFGFLLRWSSFSLPESLVVAILRTQRPYSNHHVMAYARFLTYGTLIAHVLTSALIGCVMAFFAKGREAIVTVTLALMVSALIGYALVHVVMRGPVGLVWMLWLFADPSGIVGGGIVVREIRSASTRRLSSTRRF